MNTSEMYPGSVIPTPAYIVVHMHTHTQRERDASMHTEHTLSHLLHGNGQKLRLISMGALSSVLCNFH